MAALFKQRLIKPGRDFNYSEGQKVLAHAAIKADQIVYIMGSDGPFSKVDVADADGGAATANRHSNGRLLIAKHDIPAGGYGICLPWKLVTTKDTSGAGVAVGDPVYLSQTPGTTVASNLTLTAPSATGTEVIIVGRVTKAATVALGGAIMVQATVPESRVQGGGPSTASVANAVGRTTEAFYVSVPNNQTPIDLTLEYPVTVISAAVIAKGTSNVNIHVYNGATTNKICTSLATGGTADVRTEAASVHIAQHNVAAGGIIRLVKSANGDNGDLVVITAIRA